MAWVIACSALSGLIAAGFIYYDKIKLNRLQAVIYRHARYEVKTFEKHLNKLNISYNVKCVEQFHDWYQDMLTYRNELCYIAQDYISHELINLLNQSLQYSGGQSVFDKINNLVQYDMPPWYSVYIYQNAKYIIGGLLYKERAFKKSHCAKSTHLQNLYKLLLLLELSNEMEAHAEDCFIDDRDNFNSEFIERYNSKIREFELDYFEKSKSKLIRKILRDSVHMKEPSADYDFIMQKLIRFWILLINNLDQCQEKLRAELFLWDIQRGAKKKSNTHERLYNF